MNQATRIARGLLRRVRRRWRRGRGGPGATPAAGKPAAGKPAAGKPAGKASAGTPSEVAADGPAEGVDRPTQAPTLTQRRFTTRLPVPAGTAPLPPLLVEAPPRAFVAKRLHEVGLAGYEPDTLAAWCAALQLRPPGLVYDVGANIGVFALTAALLVREGLAPAHRIVAVEPTPELVEVARRLIRRNHLDVEVLSMAFGRDDTTAIFHLSDQSDASSSLNEAFRPSTRKVEVQIERLDSDVAQRGEVPTLLKIDTETTEPDVLAGARDTLERHRPWMICEVLPGRGSEEGLQPILDGLGYRTYRLDGGGPASEGPLAGDTDYEYLNWLFTPEEPDEAFWATVATWRNAWR
ncbi:FkbM family methyltransferase [Egicoccus sp. AB-alg6-2]|uniref:FkbM family methyltransferase n=1 Tax=Egicoccus sp. AB-alg6-2 TaxID=3242692 RepID=UPI00359DF664